MSLKIILDIFAYKWYIICKDEIYLQGLFEVITMGLFSGWGKKKKAVIQVEEKDKEKDKDTVGKKAMKTAKTAIQKRREMEQALLGE